MLPIWNGLSTGKGYWLSFLWNLKRNFVFGQQINQVFHSVKSRIAIVAISLSSERYQDGPQDLLILKDIQVYQQQQGPLKYFRMLTSSEKAYTVLSLCSQKWPTIPPPVRHLLLWIFSQENQGFLYGSNKKPRDTCLTSQSPSFLIILLSLESLFGTKIHLCFGLI